MSASAGPAQPPAASPSLSEAALTTAAWPFEEARKLVARMERTGQKEVLFETGYGPSGLPHIGTFGEVARTSMVRKAFEVLTQGKVKTRLIAFSDDMDGLRKAPDNVPNQDMLKAHLGKPLTKIPDPFGKFESFAHHNNAMLRDFLDRFGFEYEFASSTDYYTSGRFDEALLHMLRNFDAPPCARSAPPPIRPSCRSIPRPVSSCRRPPRRSGRRRARSSGAIPTPASVSRPP
jgi:lysyl-tRNA synthetase class 1